uniref:Uncharacterized protein n=1 Tax=Anopheles albimanus TaxID=7167 RepID=A0A182FCN6_ANOAL
MLSNIQRSSIMGIALFYVIVLIAGTVSIAPAIADVPAVEKVPTDQLALVNFGAPGGLLSHVATSTQIVSGTGDKLDFTGDHFFGRDQEKHEYNRQAHVNLEHVRHQDPHLRRNTVPTSFAAASIITVPAEHLAEEPVVTVHREDDRSGPVIRNSGTDCAPVPAVDLRLERPHQPTAPVLSTQSQVILVQGKEPYPVLKAKQGRRSQTNVRRGSYKFIHTAKQRNGSWQRDEDSVIVPSSEQTGEINQIVVCTVDCYALEEKIQPPPKPPVEIPSDGRLW